MAIDYQRPKKSSSILLVFAIVLVLAELVLTPSFSIGLARPDFLFVLVCIIGFMKGSKPALIAGFFIGIFADLLGWGPLGIHALLYTISGYIAGIYGRNLFGEPIGTPLIMLAGITFLYQIAFAVFMTIFGKGSSFLKLLVNQALPSSIYIILTGFLVIWIISKTQNKPSVNLKGKGFR